LAAPALIFLLYRLNKALPKKTGKALVAVVSALVFSASLYLSIQLSVASSDAKNFAFYLMPLRAWEFLVGGSLVALVPMAKKMSRLMLEASGWLGILLILWAVSAVSGDEPYPKFNALYPVFGAALVMLAGLANPRVTAARCLAVTPMVWIGLVSYAWYLWHWPLMTFGRIYHFGEKNLFFDSAMAVVSLGLAWATYVLIDKRILLWRKSLTGKLGWSHVGKVAWGCAPVLLVGVTISQYYAPRVEASFTEAQAPRPASRDPECDLQRIAGVEICQEFAGNRTMGVLIGDSHGAAAYRQLARHADQRDIVIATMVGGACAPIFGLRVNIVDPGMRERCWDGRDRALPMLGTSLTPEFALLVGRWDIYTRQTGQYSLSEPGSKRPLENLHDGFVRNLRDTVIELKRRGVQRVLVIGPVPELELPAPACVIRAEKYGVDRDQRCSVPRVDVEARRDQVVAWLNESLSGLNSVRFIDPLPAFCDTEWCKPYGSQGVLYFDTNHLSDAGLEQIIQSSRNDFEWLFGSPG
ncbi:MAG TPA: acyltransferase family protein, partial [Acidovorax sp.]|nr:acyltransferase family protein [Acidovorax sp.]